MSTPSKRRLIRDFKRLSNDPPGGISGAPCPDNLMIWNAVIFGPADTPFEDGTFKLLLTFDESYPNKPPTVKFLSRMFHPNVYANGELCLDILQNRWSPTYDVAAILTSIQSLLHDPNPNSPANAEAASLYRENMKEYVRRVKATVEESWMDDEALVQDMKAEVENEDEGQEDDDAGARAAPAAMQGLATGSGSSSSGAPPQEDDSASDGKRLGGSGGGTAGGGSQMDTA